MDWPFIPSSVARDSCRRHNPSGGTLGGGTSALPNVRDAAEIFHLEMELHAAQNSLICFQPLSVKRRVVPPFCGLSSQVRTVPFHSGCSTPNHALAGFELVDVHAKDHAALSKPNSAFPPTFSSAVVSAVHQLRNPAWVAIAAYTCWVLLLWVSGA